MQTDNEVGSESYCTLVVALRVREGERMEVEVVRKREGKWIAEGVVGEE